MTSGALETPKGVEGHKVLGREYFRKQKSTTLESKAQTPLMQNLKHFLRVGQKQSRQGEAVTVTDSDSAQ